MRRVVLFFFYLGGWAWLMQSVKLCDDAHAICVFVNDEVQQDVRPRPLLPNPIPAGARPSASCPVIRYDQHVSLEECCARSFYTHTRHVFALHCISQGCVRVSTLWCWSLCTCSHDQAHNYQVDVWNLADMCIVARYH